MNAMTRIAGCLNINKIQDLINCFKIRGKYAYHFVPSKDSAFYSYNVPVLSDLKKKYQLLSSTVIIYSFYNG